MLYLIKLNIVFFLILLACGHGLAKDKFLMVSMPKEFIPYDLNEKIPYLDQRQRQDFKVSFKDGLIYDAFGELYHDELRQSIFVVDQNGQFYLANEDDFEKIKHSSFLAGKPVAGAGEMLIRQGRLVLLSNTSGHYLPHIALAEQVEKLLFAQSVYPQFEQMIAQKNYKVDVLEVSEMEKVLKFKFGSVLSRSDIYWIKDKLKSQDLKINEIPLPRPYCRRLFYY